MLKKFVLSIVILSSVFLFSSINSYGQVITGAIKNLYMIAELPIPNSDRPYELKVFEKINDDGSFEELEYSESMNYEGSYTVQISAGSGGLQTISTTVLVSGDELDYRKNFSVCNNEINQEFLLHKDYESSSYGFSEECVWKFSDFNQFQVYYAECDDICVDYSYVFDLNRFKSTDEDVLREYGFQFLDNVGGAFIGGNPFYSMDFEKEYVNF
jgi:hypothetical protein